MKAGAEVIEAVKGVKGKELELFMKKHFDVAWANSDINIEIQGHTDDVGGEEDNLALSKDRAFSVMEFLILEEVSPARIKFKGYGESLPKFENDSNINRSKNRRTDFLIL